MSVNLPSHADPPGLRQPVLTDQPEARHSYLLRLWRSGVEGGWRASLQSVQTGERHTFADVESLLAFLIEQSSLPEDDKMTR